MKFHYRIHTDNNLVRITCSGHISIEELIRYVEQINADPGFKVGMNTFADLTTARFELDFDEAEKFKRHLKQIESSRTEPCRWALYAPTSDAQDPATLFKLIFESDMIDIRVFNDKTAAEQWIASSPR